MVSSGTWGAAQRDSSGVLPFMGYIGAQDRDPHLSMVSFRLGQPTYASCIGLSRPQGIGPLCWLTARPGESDQAQRLAYLLEGAHRLPKVVLRVVSGHDGPNPGPAL